MHMRKAGGTLRNSCVNADLKLASSLDPLLTASPKTCTNKLQENSRMLALIPLAHLNY